MSSFGQRFRVPQMAAVLLLAVFCAQCLWLAWHTPLSEVEMSYVSAAHLHFRHASAEVRSPLVTLLITGCEVVLGVSADPASPQWQWILRLPFIGAGLLLGASMWYVARRLYGNAGGYIALALYVFSPMMITRVTAVRPEVLAAGGTFGAVFTSIAVAHTLYAPREVVLWNWRRILLLGTAIAVGVGAQFSVVLAVPLGLALMMYLVPERRGAALAIMGAACTWGFLLLLALYRFHLGTIVVAMRNAKLASFAPSGFVLSATWKMLAFFLLRNSPGSLLLLGVALVAFVCWSRARFFGTAAPLVVVAALLASGIAVPHSAGFSFLVIALPFLFVFISGVFADLLETRYSGLVLGILSAVLLSHALFSFSSLVQLSAER